MVKLLGAFAPAKINLFLRVVGRRADGYHELDSIFVPITLGDQITMELRSGSQRSITLACDAPSLATDERNLAVRAASAMMTEFDIDAEVSITLHKEIPVGAGLGGGSTDAGTVMRMMASLCRIEGGPRLAEIAVRLGADVPFFLNPVPARITGIGERISALRNFPAMALVVAVPPVEVSTAEVFRNLKPGDWSGAAPDTDIESIMAGEFGPGALVNDLAKVACSRWPEIGHLKEQLHEAGAYAASMSGSGSAVFGVFRNAQAASAAAIELRRKSPHILVRTASIYDIS